MDEYDYWEQGIQEESYREHQAVEDARERLDCLFEEIAGCAEAARRFICHATPGWLLDAERCTAQVEQKLGEVRRWLRRASLNI